MIRSRAGLLFSQVSVAQLTIAACLVLAPAEVIQAQSVSLSARRINDSASSPWLDGQMMLEVEEDSRVVAEFWIETDEGERVEGSRRVIDTVLDAGRHTLSLEENEQWIWLTNLEPIESYRLGGKATLETTTVELEPIAIDPASLWEESNTPPVVEPGRVYRTRFAIASNARGRSETPEFRLVATPGEPSAPVPVSSLRVTPGGDGIWAGPEPGGLREYDLYSQWPKATQGSQADSLYINLAQEATTPPLSLRYTGWSSVEPGRLTWLRTLEWRFSTPPYTTGWEAMGAESAAGAITPYYNTEFTQKLADEIEMEEYSSGVPRRVHRLRIECRDSGDLRGGWRIANLFRKPETDDERRAPGATHPDKAYDLRNRLLRFDVVLSSNVRGDEFPILLFSLGNDVYTMEHTLQALRNDQGGMAEPNEFVRHSFYMAPPHNSLTDAGEEASKRLDLSIQVVGFGPGDAEVKQVNIENLQVYETWIADLPTGDNIERLDQKEDLEANEKPWPMVSTLRVQSEREVLNIHPMRPGCPPGAVAPSRYYLADHALFLDQEDRWNLYGIFNNLDPFTPLDEDGVPLENSPFLAGLIHARSCEPGKPLDANTHGGEADFAGARFSGPDRTTSDVFVDEDQPLFFFGPWAPSVVRIGNEFIMFYTEHALEHPRKLRGFGYATTRTPWDASSWDQWIPEKPEYRLVYSDTPANTSRDLDFCLRHAATETGRQDVYHAVWIGYKPTMSEKIDGASGKVMYKSVADDPRLLYQVPESDERVIYNLHNSDSGRIDSENESPALYHDPTTDLFYLKVTKNGTLYPGHAFNNDVFVLDQEFSKVLHGELSRGDRSVLIDKDREDNLLHRPVGMISLELLTWEPARLMVNGQFRYRYRVVIADQGRPGGSAGLIDMDLVDGSQEWFGGVSPDSGVLQSPTSIVRMPHAMFDGEERMVALAADEGFGGNGEGYILAAHDDGHFRILEGLTRPRALLYDSEGLIPGRAQFGSRDQGNVFYAESVHKGSKGTPFGGNVSLRIQNPGKPNEPLTVSFFMYYPDMIGSVTLATDEEGNVTTTVGELVEAMNKDERGRHTLRLIAPAESLGNTVAVEYQVFGGGRDRRTLYFVAEKEGRPAVFASNLTRLTEAGRPRLVADADFPWDPIGLASQNGRLYVLDREASAMYETSLKSGPSTISRKDAYLAGLGEVTCLVTIDDDVFLGRVGSLGRMDFAAGQVLPLLSNSRGHGTEIGRPVSAIDLSWVIEGVDAGSKVYWSRLDPETGVLEPFTADRYIGYLPFGAVELTSDPLQPGNPWFASFNLTSQDGGYGLLPVRWMPSIPRETR